MAKLLGLKRTRKKPRYRRSIPNKAPRREAPHFYRPDLDPRQFVSFERTYGVGVDVVSQLYRTGTVVEAASPVTFRNPSLVVLEMRSRAFEALPRHDEAAKMVYQGATWSSDGALRVGEYGRHHFRLSLNIPTASEAVWRIVRSTVADAELSDKGQIGVRLDQLELKELLLEPHVLDLTTALTTPRSKELARELRRVQSSGDADEKKLLEVAATWGGRVERHTALWQSCRVRMKLRPKPLSRWRERDGSNVGYESTVPTAD